MSTRVRLGSALRAHVTAVHPAWPLSPTPQEDELAVNVMSAGTSPYMPLCFMNDEPSFRTYFSFKDALPCKRRRWVGAFLHLMRKLSLRCGGKRLLLKSPCHTARVGLLLELFPDAQFVYIHRDPLTVYQSAVHMARARTTATLTATQPQR